MKAIILAAGVGSRLRPMTYNKPKTLVEVNGKPMLGYILESLIQNNLKEIIIIVGYQKEKIINYCKKEYPQINFKFIDNDDYENTNNMYSLYLARECMTEDFLLMNADLVFDKGVISKLIKEDKSAIAVEKGIHNEESMKILVDDCNNVSSISKKHSSDVSYGCSIDVYKIIQSDIELVKEELNRIINIEKDLNQWTELMLDNLFQSKKLIAKPCDINGSRWYEIDNYEDLAKAEILFNDSIKKLKEKKIFLLDRDGTLTLGDTIIPNADKFIQILKRSDKIINVLTNNSSKTQLKHFEKFKNLNFEIEQKDILVSLDLALDFLKKNNFNDIFYLANDSVSDYILNCGFSYTKSNPQAILLTYDDEITYNKMIKITSLVKTGIPYFATHADLVCPTEEGNIPDIGTFINMISDTTNIKPNKIFGKPNKEVIKFICNKYNVNEEDIVIIGDRLYTDILLAENSKVTSILVLSGETKRGDYELQNIKADIVVPSVKELISTFNI